MQRTAQGSVMQRHSQTQFIICPVRIWGDNVLAHHLLISFLALSMLSLPFSSQGHILQGSTSPPVLIMEPSCIQGQLPLSPSEGLIVAQAHWCSCGMDPAQTPQILAVWGSLGCQNPLTALVCPSLWCWATYPGCAGWLPMLIPSQPYRKSGFNSKIPQKLSPGHSAVLGFV